MTRDSHFHLEIDRSMDDVTVEVFLIILKSFMPIDGAIGTDRTDDHFMSTRRPKGGLADSREASMLNIVDSDSR
jgi:hypothetical protein